MTKFIRNFAPKIDKKDMKKLIYLVFFAAIVAACGQSYEETKRITRLERQRLAREDSAALKVAVIPTLDCLPFFVARHYNLFDSLGADIRLKAFSSHIDCDTAILFDRVEVAASDLVRAERMKDKGKKLHHRRLLAAHHQPQLAYQGAEAPRRQDDGDDTLFSHRHARRPCRG